MTTPEQKPKQEAQPTLPAEEKRDVIPSQYKNMPSEVVEEMWQNPVYYDAEKNKTETERRRQAIQAIKKGEELREAEKTKQINERYAKLPDDQRAEFPNAQTDAVQILTEYAQGQKNIDDLSPEESFVLGKLKTAYEEFKRENPDKPFDSNFLQGIDRKVYDNLAQGLTFKVLEAEQVVSDQEKANTIRQDLGIPTQDVETPDIVSKKETTPSTAEQIKNAGNEKVGESSMYEQIANKIPIDEKNPPKLETIFPIVAGNMFGENDTQTLSGKVIGNKIYDKLVQRIDRKQTLSPQEVIQLGKEDLEDFKKYITRLGEQSKINSGKELGFDVDRPGGKTGFHLNGEDGRVSREHLFYFNKTTKEWKNPQEQQVRAYLTINQDESKNIQRHFVDLCTELYEAGIDFTGKAASPNGLEKRTDNMVLYIAASDQARAGEMIKKFLQERKIGQGHVGAAIPSPEQGLSWAPEPTEDDIKLWQDASGSSQLASFNTVVATKVAPAYLRRLAEAHLKLGN